MRPIVRCLLLVTLIVVGGPLVACGGVGDSSADAGSPGEASSGEASSSAGSPEGGRAVDLPDGTRLTLDAVPQRIVAGNNSALDLLMALVATERIVGIPADASLFASGGVSAAGTFTHYRGEDLLALEPDLVVAHSWQDLNTTSVLRQSGIPVLALPALRSFDDLETIINLLARAVDAEPAAAALWADLSRRRNALVADGSRASIGVLSYTNFGSGGWTAGADTSLHVVMQLAGLRNLAAEAGRVGNDRIDIEELLLMDPDVILVDGTAEEPGTSARYLSDEPSLRHLTALKTGRVVFLPPHLQSTVSHHLLDAAEELAARIDALPE